MTPGVLSFPQMARQALSDLRDIRDSLRAIRRASEATAPVPAAAPAPDPRACRACGGPFVGQATMHAPGCPAVRA